jgi:hypothetical protein
MRWVGMHFLQRRAKVALICSGVLLFATYCARAKDHARDRT